MTGYTFDLSRVVNGVQLVTLTHHQFDENDYKGRIFDGVPPECPALIDGQVVDAGDDVRAVLAAEQAAAEAARQAAKPAALKAVETRFLDLCQQLSGSRAKMGFADIEAIIESMMTTDPQTATALSLRLLAIDAEGKRDGGLQWWDDVADHLNEVTP